MCCCHRGSICVGDVSPRPVSAAVASLHLQRFEPVDALTASHIDVLDEGQYALLCRLCSSGLVGAACAAPPCSAFSRARLRPGGPKPVRTPEHPTGIPHPTPAPRRFALLLSCMAVPVTFCTSSGSRVGSSSLRTRSRASLFSTRSVWRG